MGHEILEPVLAPGFCESSIVLGKKDTIKEREKKQITITEIKLLSCSHSVGRELLQNFTEQQNKVNSSLCVVPINILGCLPSNAKHKLTQVLGKFGSYSCIITSLLHSPSFKHPTFNPHFFSSTCFPHYTSQLLFRMSI